jgi:teichuronic acid biosynthesis glycosyltransferase TuaC
VFETRAPANPIRTGDGPVIYLERTDQGYFRLAYWILRHRRDFDILHIHTHVDRIFLSYLVARLVGWKLIYSSTLSDRLDELVRTYRPLYRPIAHQLFGMINMFVGISPRLLSVSLPAAKYRLIPQGVRLPPPIAEEVRTSTRMDLGIAPNETVLLYLGSICERKGIHCLVEALAKVGQSRPDTRLLLVGPVLEPDYWEQIRHRTRPEILGKIIHVDFDPSPARYYGAADIFAFASVDEGFGNVLLEAMSHGLPVVSRYLDGVTEAFIEHDRNGLLFSSDENFASQLLALIEDVTMRRRIGATARTSVEANYDIGTIAQDYCRLYRQMGGATLPSGRAVFEPSRLAEPLTKINFTPLHLPIAKPTIQVVVDTESEFDWSKGVAADHGSVLSIERLPRVQEICERYGVAPCYVVDYPVASAPRSAAIMREMAARGAEIGAHLQPWTTPPFIEPVDNLHAFPANLPQWLQRQKLSTLASALEKNIGVVPRVFKAGRYGIGPKTLEVLEEMGFDVDLSLAPGFDYRDQFGPDFSRFNADLSWFGKQRRLLEIPTTGGFVGPLRGQGPWLWRFLGRPATRALRLRGLFDRAGLLSRVRLSPEGYSLAMMRRLTQQMLRSGARYLTLSFHSSSLQPGFTPYCASAADVESLLSRLDAYLAFFRQELGGEAASPHALYRQLREREAS